MFALCPEFRDRFDEVALEVIEPGRIAILRRQGRRWVWTSSRSISFTRAVGRRQLHSFACDAWRTAM